MAQTPLLSSSIGPSSAILYVEYARRYISYGRLSAQNHKARHSLSPSLCRLALQLAATQRNEKKGHICIID
jgi:hypothetical protein